MSNIVIRQPSGKLAVFSTITDTVIVWDATEDEVVEWFAQEAAESARQPAKRVVDAVVKGDAKRIYGVFAMTWQEALKSDRKHGGNAWIEEG